MKTLGQVGLGVKLSCHVFESKYSAKWFRHIVYVIKCGKFHGNTFIKLGLRIRKHEIQ